MTFRNIWFVACLAIIVLTARQADAVVITTADGIGADTYINGEGPNYHAGDSNYGSGSTLLCRRSGGDYTRKGYVRFDLGGIRASDVTLNVTVYSVSSQGGNPTTMNVWGLHDGYPGVDNSSPANGSVDDDEDIHDEFWPEMVIDWFGAPGNLGDTTMDPTSTDLLGTFTVPLDAPKYTTLSFTDSDLTALVNNDTNGVVTLAMQPAAGGAYVNLYSKEGTSTVAYRPQLVLTDAALTWDGGGGTNKSWAQSLNWDPDGLPNVSATFDDAATAAPGTVTNIVDRNFTLGSLTYQSTTNAHTTQIDAGSTLLINGLGTGRSLVVGNVPSGSADTTAVLTGGGSLVVNTPSEDILVTSGSQSSPTSESVLDLSGLANFEATINEFRMATEHVRTQAQVTLAQNNTITADAIVVASCTYTGTYDSFLRLGQASTLNTNKLIVAGARSTSKLEFDPGLSGTPTVEIRGKSGGSTRANVWIADQAGDGGYGTGGSSRATGTADFTGGSIDAMLDVVIIGRNGYYASRQPGAATGTLSFDTGTIDANQIILARTPAVSLSYDPTGYSAGEGHTYGTLNMAGGSLAVGLMMLGEVQGHGPDRWDPAHPLARQPSTMATGTFNLSGGTAVVTGDIVLGHHTSTGEATATGTINFSGGTLRAGSIVQGSGSNNVSNFNWTGGTLSVDTFGFDLVQNDTADDSFLSPGDSVGTTTVQGNYNQVGGSLVIELDGPASYDQLIVEGDVSLAGELDLTLNYDPSNANSVFKIFDNQGSNAIGSEFTNYAEGDEFFLPFDGNLYKFVISYTGGDGNDVVLGNVPEPTSLVLLVLGGLCVAACRLRRRK